MAGCHRPIRSDAGMEELHLRVAARRQSAAAMTATESFDRTAPATGGIPTIGAIGHVAVISSDLGRFRSFYEGLLGVSHVITLRMNESPGLLHAAFAVNSTSIIHVFEVPGYDPVADGLGTEIGRRGRLDHFSLLVDDERALLVMRDRLVAAGASDGAVTPLGPFLSVHFTDPDGLEGEINCPNPRFDPADDNEDMVVECSQIGWTAAFLGR
jgi:catechol 2,3-dioxygenase-like lactoylglutathione lyase family enzyme